MANHKSSIKRIRQTNARRLRNRYYAKTARNAVRVLRATEDKKRGYHFVSEGMLHVG